VAKNPGPYSEWVQYREARRQHEFSPAAGADGLALVMLVAAEPPPETIGTLESLQRQTTGQWTLTVVTLDSWQAAFTAQLAVSGLQRSSQRVRVQAVSVPGTPGQMLAAGLAANAGNPVSLLFPGDLWAPDAVAQLTSALSPGSVVYADEDCISGGEHVGPRLKPDYSPEFLLTSSYMGRPLAIGAEVLIRMAPAGDGDRYIEHDLALRACEVADDVTHVAEVLCHRLFIPADSGSAPQNGVGHITAALRRRGEVAEVTPRPLTDTYRVRRQARGAVPVTIVIPFRDEPRFLRSCIESIDATRGPGEVEFVLVDNGSVQPETSTLVERLAGRRDTRVLTDARPFNWAGLNNAAAGLASGEVLIFLNNDIEARQVGWIDALTAQAVRPDVGAVGARLLYPDGRLQHCGVVIGLGGAAGHLFVGLDGHGAGYLDMAVTTRECAAVTGACLATRRTVFDQLGGFDEALGIDLNDIDYCLRAQRSGLRVLYESGAELIHHESPSRGTAGDVRDIVHFIDRWQASISAGDPYLSPHLTRVDSSCALRGPDEEESWQQWHASLSRT
jgi:O-antigen biosynthesis protein